MDRHGCFSPDGHAALFRPRRDIPLIDRIIARGRTRHRGKMISRDEGRALLGVLKQNFPAWYPPDREYGRHHSVFADFFRQPAAAIITTARYAKMSQAPVLPF